MTYDLHIFNSRSRFEDANGDHLRADHHLSAYAFEGPISSGYEISITWPGVYHPGEQLIKYPTTPFVVAEVTEIHGVPSLILFYNGTEKWL